MVNLSVMSTTNWIYIFFSFHFFKNTIRQFSTIRFFISRLSMIVRVNDIMDLLNLFDIDALSVQRQTLQTVTRYSYALSSFCCCNRNCYAKHRGTSPSFLYANYTSLVKLRWWVGTWCKHHMVVWHYYLKPMYIYTAQHTSTSSYIAVNSGK